MLKKYLLILPLIFIIGCSSNQFTKVSWQGDLIQDVKALNYLYWRDGVQFNTQNKDSLTVSMAGFSHEEYIYILVSFNNATSRPITYFPKDSRIQYQSKKEDIKLDPVKPKNLDKSHFSFFNTILIGAGSISRLFINLPVDMFIPNEKENEEEGALSKIDEDYHTEGAKITKKIFISTHTIFPDDHYAGFLVFEYNDDLPFNNNQFNVKIIFDNKAFSGTGTFIK